MKFILGVFALGDVQPGSDHLQRRTFPVPAGGMTVERVPELIAFFGLDTVLLIGGSLLEAGPALRERTQALVASVEQAARQYRAAADERGG